MARVACAALIPAMCSVGIFARNTTSSNCDGKSCDSRVSKSSRVISVSRIYCSDVVDVELPVHHVRHCPRYVVEVLICLDTLADYRDARQWNRRRMGELLGLVMGQHKADLHCHVVTLPYLWVPRSFRPTARPRDVAGRCGELELEFARRGGRRRATGRRRSTAVDRPGRRARRARGRGGRSGTSPATSARPGAWRWSGIGARDWFGASFGADPSNRHGGRGTCSVRQHHSAPLAAAARPRT